MQTGEEDQHWGIAPSLTRFALPACGVTATSFTEPFLLEGAIHTLEVSIPQNSGEGKGLHCWFLCNGLYKGDTAAENEIEPLFPPTFSFE